MARTFAPTDLVALPRLSANAAVALGNELLTAAKGVGKLPANVQKSHKRLAAALQALEGQFAAGASAEARAYDGAAVAAADTKLDRSWGAFADFAQSFLRLPHGDEQVRADAQRVVDAAFAQGLRFLQLPYKMQWAESKARLQRLGEKGTAAAVKRLGGGLFLQTLTEAHDAYGALLNITAEAAPAPKATGSVREALEAFTAALRVYVMQVATFGIEEDENRESADALLAPIARWRVGRRASAPVDEPDEPAPAPAPGAGGSSDALARCAHGVVPPRTEVRGSVPHARPRGRSTMRKATSGPRGAGLFGGTARWSPAPSGLGFARRSNVRNTAPDFSLGWHNPVRAPR